MDRLEQLRQRIEKLNELSLEEIKELDTEIVAIFDSVTKGEIEGVKSDDLEILTELADATQDVRTRAQDVESESKAVQDKVAEIANIVHASNGDGDGGGDDSEDDDDKKDDDEKKTEPSKEDEKAPANAKEESSKEDEGVKETVEDEQDPVKAEKPAEKKVLPALAAAARRGREMQQAPVRTNSREVTFTAPDGKELSVGELALAIKHRREKFGHVGEGVNDTITMGSMKLDAPEDRRLNASDTDKVITEKVDSVIADAMNPEAWQDEALVASGGFCAPLETRYEIETIAGAHRPVRDSLPRFVADRGGLRFRAGISLAEGVALGSTGTWSATTDTTPGASTKNVGTVTCKPILEVELDAITKILKFGNLMSRADQESVQAWINTTTAAWARAAEVNLLDSIATAATNVSTDQHLGLARDFLEQVSRAAASYRSRHRLLGDARLRIMVPQWLPDAISSDLLRGQQSDPGFLSTTTQQFVALLAARNVNVTFYSDSPTSAGQVFGTQGAHDLLGWISTVKWFMFHEGAFLFLDGGVLDLGVVRDSTLNGTNDYELFAETFEEVAFVGVEALEITSNLCVSGMSAGTDDLTTQCIS